MKVLYTGAFRFPDKDAAGKRVANIIEAIKDSDHFDEIYVAGWEQGDANETTNGKLTHRSFSILDNNKKGSFYKLISFACQGFSLFNWYLRLNKKFETVILYNPPALFAFVFIIIAKINKTKLILDSTEWYESSHLKGGRFGLAAFENYVRMKLIYPRFNNIIAISKYLEKYYKGKGVKNVIRVPPLATIYERKNRKKQFNLNLLYAGSPGKKDRIDILIDKFMASSVTAKEQTHLHIVGINIEQYLSISPKNQMEIEDIKKYVTFHGRLKMDEVINIYHNVHYCIFIRDNERYALAGFPSKYVESLSMDTPVITNPVGDLTEYTNKTGIELDLTKENLSSLLFEAFDKRWSFSDSIEEIIKSDFMSEAHSEVLKKFIKNR